MAIRVSFVNPRNGEKKKVKIGWSWPLFFFASFFGIPLFIRKLNNLGFVFLANSFLNWLLPELPRDPDAQNALAFLMVTLTVGLNTWMAIKGNAMTARNLLDLGWQFEAPSSAEAMIAKQTWDLLPSTTTGAPVT